MTDRSLPEWLEYLEGLHPSAIDMGLERCREVFGRAGLTRPAPRVITVSGTNGKGSTCAFLAALLRASGLRVGVYASPHLQRYNERVRIDGVDVDDAALCQAFGVIERARGQTSLTYFEMGTLAAFWLFEQAGLDVCVLEVGLGGRLDAVNIVDPDVAVVTSIGIDHSEWLGTTRESVAREKAGIFRAGRPAVCGDPAPPESLLTEADRIGATLYLRGRDFELVGASADQWRWRGSGPKREPVSLAGLPRLALPVENAATALQAFQLLELPLSPGAISTALVGARVTGRLDRRSVRWNDRRLSLLLDVAHNPHAAEYLARRLGEAPAKGRRLAVFGLLGDKDLDGVIQPLCPIVDRWAVTALPSPRSRTADELYRALVSRQARVESFDSVREALEAQCNLAGEDDEIVLFGSFHCVAEALDWLDEQRPLGRQVQ